MTRRRAACLLAVLSAPLVLGAWQDFTIGIWYHFRDAGYFLQAAARIVGGEVPYRDYAFQHPPLSALVNALSFRMFGVSLWAGKLPLAACTAALPPLMYRWLRFTFPRRAALAGAVVAWLAAPLLLTTAYTTYYTLVPALFVFIQLARMRPGRMLWPAFWAGCGVGITMGMKHNVGGLVGLAVWARILFLTPYGELLRPLDHGTPLRRLRWVRIVATAVALGALVYLAYRVPTARRTWLLTLVPTAALTLAAVARAWRTDRDRTTIVEARPLFVACLCVAAGAVLTVLPWVWWLARADAFIPFLEYSLLLRRPGTTIWGKIYGLGFSPPWPSVGVLAWMLAAAGAVVSVASTRRHARRAGALVAVGVLFGIGLFEGPPSYSLTIRYAPVALLMAPAIALGRSDAHGRWLVMGATAIWFLNVAFPGPTAPHTATALIPILALAVAMAWHVTRDGNIAGRIATVAVVLCLCVLWWGEWCFTVLDFGPAGVQRAKLVRLAGPRGGTWMPARQAAELLEVREFLDGHAPPDAPLVAWPSISLFNLYTGRPNPTAMDYFLQGLVGPDMETRLLEELRTAAPPFIVLDRLPSPLSTNILAHYNPTLTQYIDAHYERATPMIGPFAILRLRAAPPAQAEEP